MAAENERLNESLYRAGTKAAFLSYVVNPLVRMVNHLGYVIVAVRGVVQVMNGTISIKKVLPLLVSIMILPGLAACGQKKGISETAQSSQVSEGGNEVQESDAPQTSDTAPANDEAQAAGTSDHPDFAGTADTMAPSDLLLL